MIIEFSGPSGAGKTTGIRQLIESLEQVGVPNGCIHSASLNNCPAIPPGFSEIEGQNWKVDLRAAPWAALYFLNHPALAIFIAAKLWKLPEDGNEKLSIFRSVVRKAGIRAYLSRRQFAHFAIVVDEGLVHIAHNLLMSVHRVSPRGDIDRFMALVPSPDLLVIVTAETDVLFTRLTSRGDLSPRIKAAGQLHAFARNAWNLFKMIEKTPSQRPRQLWQSDIQDVRTAAKLLARKIASSLPNTVS